MTVSTDELEFVFGPDSGGDTAEERAITSSRRFVRSQDHLALYRTGATGRVLTPAEALAAYGFETLYEAVAGGAAILVEAFSEPAASLRARREALGLAQEDVARATDLSLGVVRSAENPNSRTSIRSLERIAQALALDERLLGFAVGAGGDERLAVRLKTLASEVAWMSPSTVLQLDEAAWVSATQTRLQDALSEPNSRPEWQTFEASPNYGAPGYPAWMHGYYLAGQTRKKLGLDEEQPIENIRLLCEEQLSIPLIQLSMPARIGGATVVNQGARGIAINTNGFNENVWTRRLTIVHELGHLLWDPPNRLNSLAVDDYDALSIDPQSQFDRVEQRANAFAVEFLAPQKAAVAIYRRHDDPAAGIAAVMEHFGISFTAARYHIWNALDRGFTLEAVLVDNTRASDHWAGRESYGADYFPIRDVPVSRRGEFAGVVAAAMGDNLISEDTAAAYLRCSIQQIQESLPALRDMFPHWLEAE